MRSRIDSAASDAGGKRAPPLASLAPLNEWHAAKPALARPRRGAGYAMGGLALRAARRPSKGYSLAYQKAMRATLWSFVATVAFGVCVVLPLRGARGGIDFFTGFLVEESLSVDNLFVFLMLFEYFQVPEQYTQRVLNWGILSALVLRGAMLAAGVAIVRKFRPVLLGFALILVFSAVKMLRPEDETDLKDNPVMALARRCVDATDTYDGEKFFTRVGGVRKATPLLVVLICIEISDVIFAVDSIPAVVGITQDPLVVYSSNFFALMALRSLYLLLSKSVATLFYLRHAVALILLFVGLKMVAEFYHFEVGPSVSLVVIVLLLVTGTVASLARSGSFSFAVSNARAVRDDHSAV